MNCCDDYGQCTQGPGCPVRTTTTPKVIYLHQTQHHDTLAQREVAAAEADLDPLDVVWRWALSVATFVLATGVFGFVLGVLVGRLTSHC